MDNVDLDPTQVLVTRHLDALVVGPGATRLGIEAIEDVGKGFGAGCRL